MEIFMPIAMVVLSEIMIFLLTDSWTVVMIGAVGFLIIFFMYISLYLIIDKSDTEENNNIKTCYYCGREIGDPFIDLNDLDDELHQFPNKNEKCCLFCHSLVTQTNYYLKNIIDNSGEEEGYFEGLKLHISAVQKMYTHRKECGY